MEIIGFMSIRIILKRDSLFFEFYGSYSSNRFGPDECYEGKVIEGYIASDYLRKAKYISPNKNLKVLPAKKAHFKTVFLDAICDADSSFIYSTSPESSLTLIEEYQLKKRKPRKIFICLFV